jgi:hypothetical protein
VLDALPEEEKSGLEGEGGKLLKETDLFVNLLLQEGSPERGCPNSCTKKGDAVSTDVLDVVDRRLGLVEGEGRAARGEELVDMADRGGIVGEDDNVVKVGEDDGRRGIGGEGGEVFLEVGEGVADGEGEKEGS